MRQLEKLQQHNKPYMMKRLIFILMALLGLGLPMQAQNPLNNEGDNILGYYSSRQNQDYFKVHITQKSNGTYKAQIYWLEKSTDAQGNKILDEKNPDKTLRKLPCDRIVLIDNLHYNAEKKVWDGTKVYDPQRGFKAKCVVWFDKDGNLKVKGSLMGISETVTWKKLKEK